MTAGPVHRAALLCCSHGMPFRLVALFVVVWPTARDRLVVAVVARVVLTHSACVLLQSERKQL